MSFLRQRGKQDQQLMDLGNATVEVFTVFCGLLEPKIGGAAHRLSWSLYSESPTVMGV